MRLKASKTEQHLKDVSADESQAKPATVHFARFEFTQAQPETLASLAGDLQP